MNNAITPRYFETENGTRYVYGSGVVLLSCSNLWMSPVQDFLDNLIGDHKYLDDTEFDYNSKCEVDESTLAYPEIKQGAELCKFAGQLCYHSFGEGRTKNKDSAKYFDNIKSSGHWSVLEHANYSFLFYGVSRSLTHELVRHRHFSYSQTSQRYVDDKNLRFVCRPEIFNDDIQRNCFEINIDQAIIGYRTRRNYYMELYKDLELSRTDRIKKSNQIARSILPNETETQIVATGNARAWRHFLEMRCSPFAEPEIRGLAYNVYKILREVAPDFFNDYIIMSLNDNASITDEDKEIENNLEAHEHYLTTKYAGA